MMGPENATKVRTTRERMGVVVRAILLCADVAKRTGTKGNHKERPGDVEPEGRRRGMSLGLFEITTGGIYMGLKKERGREAPSCQNRMLQTTHSPRVIFALNHRSSACAHEASTEPDLPA